MCIRDRALVAATRASHRIGGLLSHEQDEQVMLRVLGLTMLVPAATHLLGASAAVGAFLVGIAIPGTLAERARDILGPQRALFAEIFFVSFGLGTNPRDLLAYLPVAAVLALVGVLSKVEMCIRDSLSEEDGRRLRHDIVLVEGPVPAHGTIVTDR